jgi:VCBS repeat-containing protein
MAITAAVCDSYKQEILSGEHLSTDTYKMALYTSSATLDETTTEYDATGEVTGTGYSAGGTALSGFTTGLEDGTAYLTFTNPTWSTSTITARGALIYNSDNADKAVCVLDFGEDVSSASGLFTVSLPDAGASSTVTIA